MTFCLESTDFMPGFTPLYPYLKYFYNQLFVKDRCAFLLMHTSISTIWWQYKVSKQTEGWSNGLLLVMRWGRNKFTLKICTQILTHDYVTAVTTDLYNYPHATISASTFLWKMMVMPTCFSGMENINKSVLAWWGKGTSKEVEDATFSLISMNVHH